MIGFWIADFGLGNEKLSAYFVISSEGGKLIYPAVIRSLPFVRDDGSDF